MKSKNYRLFQTSSNLPSWIIGENKKFIEFNYQTQFIFSKLGETKDNIPQLAHVDIKGTVNDLEEECLGVKTCIGFTPINLDGVMLQVWNDSKCKTYCSTVEVIEDEEWKKPKPGNMCCIFLTVFLLYFLEIQFMLAIFVLAWNCHAQAEMKAI